MMGPPAMVTSPIRLFAKRFWGFDPQKWPIISFSKEGNRDALVRASGAGDRIVFVGTNTEDTDLADRGRLLGMAEIGRIPIDSAQVLDKGILRRNAFDAAGNLRWPKALPMLRAWRFVSPPKVTEVLRRQLSYEATVRAVLLDDVDTRAIFSIPHEEIGVREIPAIARLRILQDSLPGKPTTGPRPSSWTGQTGRNADEAASTYAFRFGKRDLWKIGHAKDVRDRLADVNRHVPTEVLREQWHEAFVQPWITEVAAHEMEQRLLQSLRTPGCIGERVACSEKVLQSAWIRALTPKI